MPTSEQQPTRPVTDGATNPETTGAHFRTIALRVEENLHTQLRFIAQLAGSSISEEIRQAIENRINSAQDDPELIARAQQAREEIEREANARKAAIAGFMGPQATGATTKPEAKPSDRPARTTGRSTSGR